MKTIYFYAPTDDDYRLIQHDYDRWVNVHGNFVAWVAPTYYHLKKAGFDCEIVREMPEEGIVLADRDTLGDKQPYLNKVLLICAKSDREFHPSATIHVVHNRADISDKNEALWHPYYIPHWPLPGLIPRDPGRGDRVENIAYIGTRSQLAAELKSDRWREELAKIGCNWVPVLDPNKWNDYTNIDAVVAARMFGEQMYFNKGAIKLFNCWRAGVAAILAPESGFLKEKNDDLDFITVNSLESALEAVKKLRDNPPLYRSMIDRCRERAVNITTEATLKKWATFFEDVVFPMYERWSLFPDYRQRLPYLRRYLELKIIRTRDRLGLNPIP